MKARDLLRGDAKHYVFLIEKKYAKDGKITLAVRSQKMRKYFSENSEITLAEFEGNKANWDFSKSMGNKYYKINANLIALMIDNQKGWEIDYFEFVEGTLYGHVRINK